MANVKNQWLGYLDRSFSQIKDSLLNRVTLSNPELTDHSSSNIFIIIIEMFAAMVEMLGYYVDNIAEESFLVTAQRRSSVIKHVRGLDYRVKARSPEQVDIIILWDQPVPAQFTLSAGMRIDSVDGIRFISTSDVVVNEDDLSTIVPVSQVTEITNAAFALTTGVKNEMFSLGTDFVQGSLTLTIDGEEYTEVSTFAHSLPTDRHFIVEVREDGNAYFILGNGTKGVQEAAGLTVAATYRTTLGAAGKVGAGKFDDSTLVFNNVLPGTLDFTSANSAFASAGGADYEETEDIRSNAIASIRTIERAVTRQDYVDVLEALESVAKAAVHFCCGKTVDLYIVPAGGGVASSGIIAEAQAEIDGKKMVTTFPVVSPAGETSLVVKATVTARKRKSIIETKTQVETALIEWGQIENQEINGAVRLSDLQALIDNLPNVDFVELTSLYTKPYARAVVGVNALIWTNETRLASIAISKWRIEYDGVNFRIFRDGVFLGTLGLGAQFVALDNSFTFTINAGAYSAGDTWEFNTYPFLANIELTDFTILSISALDLAITVNAAPTTPVSAC